MGKIKTETNEKAKKYPPGTILAVDMYENGNFFEAELKKYKGTTKGKQKKLWAFVQYLDDLETKKWIDLNLKNVVELVKDNILTEEDRSEDADDDEKGYLGRRLSVLWDDGVRYTGRITKTLKDNYDFVYIHYDNGDKCWYNLLAELQAPSQIEEKHKASSSIKKTDEVSQKHEAKKKQLQAKYPIGSLISVDVYHDEHYHDAIVKKYNNANKKQQAKGEQWVHIQFLDKAKTKQWIDLSCIKAVKMTDENILRLNELEPGDDRGFLGKKIVVQWRDGNKYRGIATRCAKDNKHFVYLEYDDGDECWCDLQREGDWNIDGEEDLNSDSSYENAEGTSKRRGRAASLGKSFKKAKSTEEEFDF